MYFAQVQKASRYQRWDLNPGLSDVKAWAPNVLYFLFLKMSQDWLLISLPLTIVGAKPLPPQAWINTTISQYTSLNIGIPVCLALDHWPNDT